MALMRSRVARWRVTQALLLVGGGLAAACLALLTSAVLLSAGFLAGAGVCSPCWR